MKSYAMNIFLAVITFSSKPFAQQMKMPTAANYDVEKSNRRTYIEDSGRIVTFVENEFIVKNETGRMELSLNRIPFTGKNSNFRLVKAYSQNQKQIFLVSPDEVSISALQNVQFGLTDYKQAIVPMSNLKVGSRVYFSYEVVEENSTFNYGEGAIVISNSSLGRQEVYRYESKKPLKTVFLDPENYYLMKQGQSNGNYFVELSASPVAYQNVGKHIVSASLMVSTADSWLSVNKNLSPEYDKILTQALPKELQAIAIKVKTLQEPKEKIEYAAKEISKIITYSGDWRTEKNRFVPQSFQSLIKSKKGDCKDYSSVMTAILRNAGFTAFPALILKSPTFVGKERLLKISKLPGVSTFNHAIVWAKDPSGKQWWIDPTNPLVFADTLSGDILGNYALILDSKSQDVSFLPEQNSSLSDITVEQSMILSPDGLVQATGKIQFSETGFLSIGMVERMAGAAGLNKLLGFILHPRKGIEINSKKRTETRIPDYIYSFASKNFIEFGSKKERLFAQPNPVENVFRNVNPENDSYVGELGTFKLVTKIKNVNTPDEFESDCLVLSPWINVERYVENKNQDLIVTDTITTKKRVITKEEMKSDDFSIAMSDLRACLASYEIPLDQNVYSKSPEDIEIESKLGPPIQKMSVEDMYRLEKLSGPSLQGLASRKMLKYGLLQLQKNPNDVDAMFASASGIINLGYVSGTTYQKSYIKEAIDRLNKAAAIESPSRNKILKKRAQAFLYLGDFKSASADVSALIKLEPNAFSTRTVASDLARLQKAYPLAEQWLKAAGAIAKTVDEKTLYNGKMAHLYIDQQKSKEAILHYEEVIKLDPKNAWAYHNASAAYAQAKNIDRAIELELKAVQIREFGLAKKTLSDLYVCKAGYPIYFHCVDNNVRIKSQQREALFLESLKWNSENEWALEGIAEYYYSSFQKNPSDRLVLEKAKTYFDQAIRLNPKARHLAERENAISTLLAGGTVKVQKLHLDPNNPASGPKWVLVDLKLEEQKSREPASSN